MKILVINSGSSSIKFRLVNGQTFATVAKGILERIGMEHSNTSYTLYNAIGVAKKLEQSCRINNHEEGFKLLIEQLHSMAFIKDLMAIGHRVVHGGETFTQPVLITESVIDTIRATIPLAPLHNPANLTGIEICRQTFPSTPQIAVFDTAFHQTIPAKAYRYPLTESLYKKYKIRRYGFHGTSHHYVAQCAAQVLEKPISQLNLITLHLGNGASATAIQGGCSIDTSMGMTPLEGLMMGTRSGDVDPAIIFYLARVTKLDLDEIETLLNQKSGLLGLCATNDMQKIQLQAEQGNQLAKLAIEIYCYRIKKYIGAYIAILGRLDGLIFTAGVGENSSIIRLQVCQGLEHLGICIDAEKNISAINTTEIQIRASPVKILLIPTDEETEIARQTLASI
jgi:acetate kinase